VEGGSGRTGSAGASGLASPDLANARQLVIVVVAAEFACLDAGRIENDFAGHPLAVGDLVGDRHFVVAGAGQFSRLEAAAVRCMGVSCLARMSSDNYLNENMFTCFGAPFAGASAAAIGPSPRPLSAWRSVSIEQPQWPLAGFGLLGPGKVADGIGWGCGD
jgi:hypothetical protein